MTENQPMQNVHYQLVYKCDATTIIMGQKTVALLSFFCKKVPLSWRVGLYSFHGWMGNVYISGQSD